MAWRLDRDFEVRLALARKSYEEVLDATKHQDDKIGRFLTAIAFFTVAAVTLISREESLLRVTYRIDGLTVPMPAILFGVYLVSVISSVLLFILALGPNLTLPGRIPGVPAPTRQPSHLFFLAIRNLRLEEWRALWKRRTTLRTAVLQNFIDEAHNIAKKTFFKYRRANEARACFTLGLLALTLGVILGAYPLTSSPAPRAPVQWSGFPAWSTAAVIAGFAFILAYDYWRLEWEDQDQKPHSWPTLVGVLSLPVYVGSLVGLGFGSLGPWGLAGTTMSMAAIVLTRIWFAIAGGSSRGHAALGLLLPMVAAAAAVLVIVLQWLVWQIVLAGLVVVALEIPRIYRIRWFALLLLGRQLER